MCNVRERIKNKNKSEIFETSGVRKKRERERERNCVEEKI